MRNILFIFFILLATWNIIGFTFSEYFFNSSSSSSSSPFEFELNLNASKGSISWNLDLNLSKLNFSIASFGI